MKNLALQAKFASLGSIGLDSVNSAVNDAIDYIVSLENSEPLPLYDDRLVSLEAEVASANAAQARIASVLEAIANSDLNNKQEVLAFFA